MTARTTAEPAVASAAIDLSRAAGFVLRYGLVLIVFWIGAMKFTEYEAKGIQPLVSNSPLLSWMYQLLSVTGTAKLLGVVELITAALIAMRSVSNKACQLGSVMAMAMFLITLSFLFSTPGWEPSLGGFPALSANVGQFVLKDVVLFGAALWSFAEARRDELRYGAHAY